MKIFGRLKKYIAALLVMIVLFSSSFSIKAYAGDPLTTASVSTILQALRNVFTGIAFGRAGLSSNSSTSDLLEAVHSVEDDIMGGESIIQYLASPLPWMQGINYTISKLFEYSSYEEYCEYYDYDETDRNILNLYIYENNLGSVDNETGYISIKAPVVNNFTEFMRKYKTDLSEKMDDIISSSTNLPALEKYYFTYEGNQVQLDFAGICVENNISESNYSIVTKDFTNSNLPAFVQNAVASFVGKSGFNILETAFILSYSNEYILLNVIPDDSILCYGSVGLLNVVDYTSFLYAYVKSRYNINLIYKLVYNFYWQNGKKYGKQ